MSGHYVHLATHIFCVQAKYLGLEKQSCYVIIGADLRINSRNSDTSKFAVY